jgi:hypothetical protein
MINHTSAFVNSLEYVYPINQLLATRTTCAPSWKSCRAMASPNPL